MKSRTARTLALSFLTLTPAMAHAGPPLICWPMSIGQSPSLPWGSGWREARPDYDRARLSDDTLALLGPQTGVLVRMETLRRAALYASTDDGAAKRLFDGLRARIAGAGDERSRAFARFDLGYAVEAYRQTRWEAPARKGIETPEDGYALVDQALAALRSNPEMEYAAALVAISRPNGTLIRGLAEKHLQIAAASSAEGSDLARTLAAHAALWGDRMPKPGALAAR